MKVRIEFDLRPLDPISEDEDAPSDSLDNREDVEAKVENAVAFGMSETERVLFDNYGWIFDTHTVTVTE